jgi:hypothetical protein
MVTSAMEDDKLRREVLENDRKVREQQQAGTFFSHTHPEDEVGGRFARVSPMTIVGATPIPKYPQLPSGPWSGSDPVGQEPPTGVAIDYMRPLEPSMVGASSVEATGPTSADAPSPSSLGDEQRDDVGPSSPQKGAGNADTQ